MVIANHRPTRLLISRHAIAHNLAAVREASHAKTVFLAVKANAYGYGLLEVGKAALEGGADGLAVAVIDEALALRESGVTAPILIMSLVQPEYAQLCADYDLITTVGSRDWLKTAAAQMDGRKQLLVSIAVDTGMGRIGYRDRAEIDASLEFMAANPSKFNYHGLMTHFSEADSVHNEYFNKQLTRWHELTDTLPKPVMVHVANSSAAMYHADKIPTDVIRAGTIAYGIEPSLGSLRPADYLEQIERLETQLIFVKQMHAGDGISYAHIYQAKEGEWVGTLPLGYGDGLTRKLTGFHVLVNGQECQILGKIAMDAMMIRLPGPLPLGTKVTVLGKDGDKRITLDDMAAHTGLAPWEQSIIFTERLPRVVVDDFNDASK
ncbi:alanine racemase [Lacticaseibacillus zhaodongensis]|uniref:alanine racemase n=1 Tax=Lacticaseibacillus zhaodongensis TaxID=2668065 RepID=UPI0012D3171D|nr:alanine racemase [Lacticaseibacillus zhaodongensis]